MKKHLFKLLKKIIVMLFLISSGIALYIQLNLGSQFDPIEIIQQLQSDHRRDEALDLLQFMKENGNTDSKALDQLEKDLEYTTIEKGKSLIDGAVTGRVYDAYSGTGAIASDLCLYGDVRDLSIQTWKYIKAEKTDAIVAVLSGIGIALSLKPWQHVLSSWAKNTVKYLRRVSGFCNSGVLKKILKGKLSFEESKVVFGLIKKTAGRYRALFPYYPDSKV